MKLDLFNNDMCSSGVWAISSCTKTKTLPQFNSLWPIDAIWWHRSGSTLAQAMACCLMAPSHCLNQYWLMMVIWDPFEHNITRDTFSWKFHSHLQRANAQSFHLTHLPLVLRICQRIGWALVQIMACRLFGAKPLSKPMLACCQLDP